MSSFVCEADDIRAEKTFRNRVNVSPEGLVKSKRLVCVDMAPWPAPMRNPFKYFETSPEIIRLAVMMYIRFPLSLHNVNGLRHERGIDVTHDQAL